MVTYTYLPASREWGGRTVEQQESFAHRTLGERVAGGWDAVQRFIKTPSGGNVSVTVLLSHDGDVWAIYVSEEWESF